MKRFYDAIGLISALISIFVFITGISSLPSWLLNNSETANNKALTLATIFPQSMRWPLFITLILVFYASYFYLVVRMNQWLARQGILTRRIYSKRTYQKIALDKHYLGDDVSLGFFTIFGLLLWLFLYGLFFGWPFDGTANGIPLLEIFLLWTIVMLFFIGLICYVAREAASRIDV